MSISITDRVKKLKEIMDSLGYTGAMEIEEFITFWAIELPVAIPVDSSLAKKVKIVYQCVTVNVKQKRFQYAYFLMCQVKFLKKLSSLKTEARDFPEALLLKSELMRSEIKEEQPTAGDYWQILCAKAVQLKMSLDVGLPLAKEILDNLVESGEKIALLNDSITRKKLELKSHSKKMDHLQTSLRELLTSKLDLIKLVDKINDFLKDEELYVLHLRPIFSNHAEVDQSLLAEKIKSAKLVMQNHSTYPEYLKVTVLMGEKPDVLTLDSVNSARELVLADIEIVLVESLTTTRGRMTKTQNILLICNCSPDCPLRLIGKYLSTFPKLLERVRRAHNRMTYSHNERLKNLKYICDLCSSAHVQSEYPTFEEIRGHINKLHPSASRTENRVSKRNRKALKGDDSDEYSDCDMDEDTTLVEF
ncbi:hypothetical protein HDE_00770 [Halotydeus destructor]|nr:hypothetical protein HDE_00770 [Halotydeus destructor]